MDKKELRPVKKCSAFFFLFSLILVFVSGCNTVKGAAAGAGKDLKSIQNADQGMRDVLW